jgi:uncharacterized phage infection (PIP) family protein YhgE
VKLSLFQRMGLTIALATVFGASVTSWLFFSRAQALITVSQDLKIQAQAIRLQGDLDMMHDAIRSDLTSAALVLATGTDRTQMDAAFADLEEHTGIIQRRIAGMQELALPEGVRKTLKEASARIDDFVRYANTAKAALQTAESYSPELLTAFTASFDELEPYFASISDEMIAANSETAALADKEKQNIRSLLLGQILLGTAFGLCMYFCLSRLAPRLMKAHLTEVYDAVERTKEGARELGQTSTMLAEGASHQAAAVEEISASITELNHMTREGTEHASVSIEKGASTRNSMERAWLRSQALLRQMQSIRTSGAEVAKFTKTIDEVAFQTSILSLNASVEAARAGQAGLGFAVVADEVRSLAAKTAQSSKEITSRIHQAIVSIEEGETINKDVTEEIDLVKEEVTHVDLLLNELSQRLSETSEGLSELTKTIASIDKNTQSIAAASEETASMVIELVDNANRSEEAVMKLRAIVGIN